MFHFVICFDSEYTKKQRAEFGFQEVFAGPAAAECSCGGRRASGRVFDKCPGEASSSCEVHSKVTHGILGTGIFTYIYH